MADIVARLRVDLDSRQLQSQMRGAAENLQRTMRSAISKVPESQRGPGSSLAGIEQTLQGTKLPRDIPKLITLGNKLEQATQGVYNRQIGEMHAALREMKRLSSETRAAGLAGGRESRVQQRLAEEPLGRSGEALRSQKKLVRSIEDLMRIDKVRRDVPLGSIGAVDEKGLEARKRLLTQLGSFSATPGAVGPIGEYLRTQGVSFPQKEGITSEGVRQGLEKLYQQSVKEQEMLRQLLTGGRDAAAEGQVARQRRRIAQVDEFGQLGVASPTNIRAAANASKELIQYNRMNAGLVGQTNQELIEQALSYDKVAQAQQKALGIQSQIATKQKRISSVAELHGMGAATSSQYQQAATASRQLVQYTQSHRDLVGQTNMQLAKQAERYDQLANKQRQAENRMRTHGFGAIERSFTEQKFMQQIGSASAGVMLLDGVSQAAEGNITALGFSLIFLQFSMWKIAIPAAILAAAIKPIVKNIKDMHKEVKAIRTMALLLRQAGVEAKYVGAALEHAAILGREGFKFPVEDITKATQKLAGQDLRLGERQLIQLGNIANETGRSIDEVAAAFLALVRPNEYSLGGLDEFRSNLLALIPRGIVTRGTEGTLNDLNARVRGIFSQVVGAGIEPRDRAKQLLGVFADIWGATVRDPVDRFIDDEGVLTTRGMQESAAQQREAAIMQIEASDRFHRSVLIMMRGVEAFAAAGGRQVPFAELQPFIAGQLDQLAGLDRGQRMDWMSAILGFRDLDAEQLEGASFANLSKFIQEGLARDVKNISLDSETRAAVNSFLAGVWDLSGITVDNLSQVPPGTVGKLQGAIAQGLEHIYRGSYAGPEGTVGFGGLVRSGLIGDIFDESFKLIVDMEPLTVQQYNDFLRSWNTLTIAEGYPAITIDTVLNDTAIQSMLDLLRRYGLEPLTPEVGAAGVGRPAGHFNPEDLQEGYGSLGAPLPLGADGSLRWVHQINIQVDGGPILDALEDLPGKMSDLVNRELVSAVEGGSYSYTGTD